MRREAWINLLPLAGLIVIGGSIAAYRLGGEQQLQKAEDVPVAQVSQPENSPSIDSQTEVASEREPTPQGWLYSREPDAIRGGTRTTAILNSDRSFNDRDIARLELSKQPGSDSRVQISFGMGFICGSPGCSLPVAFDGRQGEWFFQGRPDGFLATDADALIAKIEGSDELIVELPTSNSGPVQVRFKVSGLQL